MQKCNTIQNNHILMENKRSNINKTDKRPLFNININN